MSRSQPSAFSSQSHSLTEAASSIVCRIPKLLRRLRDLENEEAELDARKRQLVEQLPETDEELSATLYPTTPISKLPSQAKGSKIDISTPSTPLHMDPRNVERQAWRYVVEEPSSAPSSATSLKNKRRGRIFIVGESSEFGERRLS